MPHAIPLVVLLLGSLAFIFNFDPPAVILFCLARSTAILLLQSLTILQLPFVLGLSRYSTFQSVKNRKVTGSCFVTYTRVQSSGENSDMDSQVTRDGRVHHSQVKMQGYDKYSRVHAYYLMSHMIARVTLAVICTVTI